MTSPFASFGDTLLLERLQQYATICEQVQAMPEDERTRPGPKGAASPQEAGAFTAMLVVQAEAEAARRGLVEPRLGDLA